MSDPTRPAQSDFIREMQRLLADQREAIRSKDAEQIAEADEAMTLFLRYSEQGRLAEYMALQRARAGDRA